MYIIIVFVITFNQIKELDSKNYFTLFNRQNVCFTHGNKSVLFDTNKNSYIDFFSGIAVNCLGYNHPKLNKAITNQAKKLIHCSNIFYTEVQVKLCEELLKDTGFSRMLLVNSGAEAVEAAIKLARKYFYERSEKRHTIVTAYDSFHGRTLAAVTATGQEKFHKGFAPLPEGFKYTPYNDLQALKKLINSDSSIAAVMLECVQGENGVKPATFEYLVGAYALCKAKGILFIVDEIQTGMGRTGKMFGFEHFGIAPDIITLAKGLGGGMPVGALLATEDVAKAFKPGDHGSTFGGNPLACSAASVVVNELKHNGLLDRVSDLGTFLTEKLAPLKKYKFVKDIRGMGLLQAIELTDDLKNVEVVGKMLSKGFILNAAGSNTLRIAPPLIITKQEITLLANALNDLFANTNI